MGYRFVISEIDYQESIKAGEKIEISLTANNVGVAPIYNKLPLKIRIKGISVKDYQGSIPNTLRLIFLQICLRGSIVYKLASAEVIYQV